jgi:hypothetical protein
MSFAGEATDTASEPTAETEAEGRTTGIEEVGALICYCTLYDTLTLYTSIGAVSLASAVTH